MGNAVDGGSVGERVELREVVKRFRRVSDFCMKICALVESFREVATREMLKSAAAFSRVRVTE